LLATAATVAAGAMPALARRGTWGEAPGYLTEFSDLHELDPRGAARAWFAQARMGLLLQLGLGSGSGRVERLASAEREALAQRFRPDRFDADLLTDLAGEAGMSYINLPARGAEGFCLFASRACSWSTAESAARRDLVAELAHQCSRKRLGLFLTYEYAQEGQVGSTEPGARRAERARAFERHIRSAHTQLAELLTHYGPIAGLCLGRLAGYYEAPELFCVRETYALVRHLQPQCLLAFGEGADGSEDFASIEPGAERLDARVAVRFGDPSRTALATRAWESNKRKHHESLVPLRPPTADSRDGGAEPPRNVEELVSLLASAARQRRNVLWCVSPKANGGVREEEVRTLRALGARLRTEGVPT
jgi:alpha-L-fucosidase